MKQKIRMPGTGPPLGTRVPIPIAIGTIGITAHSTGWRLFPRGHPFANGIFRCIRTDEDVGWWFGPNPEGLGNFQALKSSCKAREPADILSGSSIFQALKSNCKAREPAGHPPEKVCRSGTRSEAASVRMDILVRIPVCRPPDSYRDRRDGTVIRIRDDTAIPVRNGPDGENLHRRHKTAVRAGYSTGLGSRNAATRQPVHPPEWERYGRGRRKCRIMNNQYPMMSEEYRISLPGLLTGNSPVRRSDGESENNIPVLRTSGYNADSNSTNIIGALHLLLIVLFARVSRPAAELRNICRTACYSSERKVQPALSADRRTVTLTRKMEYRISLPGLLTGNSPVRRSDGESENNIPVLRTSGYNADSNSTNIIGALHLGFQHTGIAISETAAAPRNTLSGIQWNCRTSNGETAAAPQNILTCNQRIWNEQTAAEPRNICSDECNPFEMKVQPALSAARRTETLKQAA